uniref:transposase n=1 Tax=Candidatus Enterovibrio escicola TaxID=1927127 RepID=UPI001CC2377D|nr:transposase [Candidatus Enterovibrio escacola]
MLKLIQGVLVPLCSYLTHPQAKLTGSAFVNSSKLQVWHNLRILKHQVFKGTSKRGKRTMGVVLWRQRLYLWFIGVGICRKWSDTDNGCKKI